MLVLYGFAALGMATIANELYERDEIMPARVALMSCLAFSVAFVFNLLSHTV